MSSSSSAAFTPMSTAPPFKFPAPLIPTPTYRRRHAVDVSTAMSTATSPHSKNNSGIPSPDSDSEQPLRAMSFHQSDIQNSLPMPQLEDPKVDYLKLILNARVYDVAIESPLQMAKKLSAKLGNLVYVKREDLQPIFSFKLRGAYNRMYQLSPLEREKGIIAASAGNHAQGVAIAAQKLGIKATVVMPKFAPDIKVENVRRLGAQVILHGNDFDEAKRECMRLREEQGLTFIPPFDDKYVIAGAGTVGVEILRQLKQDRLDAIFVCCGGGGLLAGIAAFVKRIRPEVRVIGVNTVDSDSMTQSLIQGHPVELKETGLFADGTSVRLVGQETFRICQEFVDDMISVNNDEICSAIRDCFEDTRSILEPAGAQGLAGCVKFVQEHPEIKDGVFVVVASGANMNFDRLRFVAERAKLGDGKEVLISAIIPERPGTFLKLFNCIHPRVITEFSYRFNDPEKAHVYMSFEVQTPSELPEIIQLIESQGMEAIDISQDEMAKSHARYMAGGRSQTVGDERVLRFSWKERPGSLKKFLNVLENSRWNMSMWHYRNHGADVARLLVGAQVKPEELEEWTKFIEGLGYPYVDESDSAVYKHFMR
ncbi:threonine ammonia-lyase [Synchytrium microbalum]|uniref:Threonine dehydratase n=1 Tax=Synchytrium microbalum TaxID=1806994 RepID=A0A507BSW4_9FUNG|nr:threonine ammonia-lyase [Synchytrium microbalum]TPX30468.1 threonine ammonia-lyase [Synchytrium microbalum]